MDERSLITVTLISSCHWKTLPFHWKIFFLAKEKTEKHIFNTNSELSQNCTEIEIMPCKTTINWLFNNIWRYLFIDGFDWKIAVFHHLQGFIISFNCINLCYSREYGYFYHFIKQNNYCRIRNVSQLKELVCTD